MLLEILAYPFMQRAFTGGILIGFLLSNLGVLATIRKMSFFSEGIAHASLAGIAIAIVGNLAPLPVALVWAIFIAILIYVLERSTKLHSDTVIGVLFTSSMALGVIIMSQTAGYQPELISFLFGNILAVNTNDLLIMFLVTLIIITWFYASLRQLIYLSLSDDSATVSGIKTKTQTLIFYIALALATVLGVKILGIVLVSALLILPAATSRLLTPSFFSYMLVSVLICEASILAGLILSFLKDLPSGASIVLMATVFFAVAVIFNIFTSRK